LRLDQEGVLDGFEAAVGLLPKLAQLLQEAVELGPRAQDEAEEAHHLRGEAAVFLQEPRELLAQPSDELLAVRGRRYPTIHHPGPVYHRAYGARDAPYVPWQVVPRAIP
jgi:hypothetical protein